MPTKNTSVFLLFLFFCILLNYAQNNQVKQSLFFAHDSWQLTNNHIKIIDSLNALFNNHTVQIDLKGYTNNLGTKKYNLKLSNKRVKSVENAFTKTSNISAIGFGELENSSLKSRRVDILISVFNKNKILEKQPILKTEINNLDKAALNTKEVIKIGKTYRLEGVLFKGAEANFLEESYPELNKLLAIMKANKYKIKLLGHICCTTNGKDGFNKITKKNTLSVDRAKAVYNYLIENGIDKNRMTYVGLAGAFPTGKAAKYDRRVEIEILSFN